MLNSHWGRAATDQKVLPLCMQGCFGSVRLFVTLTMAFKASLSGRWVLQARILEHIGQYWWSYLSRAYISCCLSRQLLWVPGAARTPATQAAAPPPHLALTGANPSPPGQPQEQTPVDDSHAEVEIKPQLKPRGSVAEEEDQNLPTSCTSCRLNPHDQLGRLCVYGIYKRSLRAPTKEMH